MFAKPLVGALDGHGDGVFCSASSRRNLVQFLSGTVMPPHTPRTCMQSRAALLSRRGINHNKPSRRQTAVRRPCVLSPARRSHSAFHILTTRCAMVTEQRWRSTSLDSNGSKRRVRVHVHDEYVTSSFVFFPPPPWSALGCAKHVIYTVPTMYIDLPLNESSSICSYKIRRL